MKTDFKKNLGAGWLYFYIHFITEVACFFVLSRAYGSSIYLWIVPLIYDALAFVPQSVIGKLSDRFPKISFGVIGAVLLALGVAGCGTPIFPGKYTALAILSIGNACTHINGAEVTLRCSGGHLSHSAIFVGGGSFGVICGKLLGETPLSFWFICIFALTMIPFVLLAETYRTQADAQSTSPCAAFDCHSKKIAPCAVIILAVLIVAVRGYMGYGIPTSWNKTAVQTVMLYVTMGIGKLSGGILADIFGIKKVALFSAAAALPFLFTGDNIMAVSLIGVMLFSMTMSVTLAILVSVLKNAPGLAFGLTTIGLFIGSVPIFFFKFTTVKANCTVIAILTVFCLIAMQIIIRKDEKNVRLPLSGE